MKGSITRRLMLASSLLAIGFLGLAGLSLYEAYRDSSDDALRQQLQAHIYMLLATAEEDAKGSLRMPEALPSPGFNRPDSGQYAQVSSPENGYHWRSPSMLGRDFPLDSDLAVGEQRLLHRNGYVLFEQAVSWEDYSGQAQRFVLGVAADSAPLLEQQQAFRRTLWTWLGGVGVLLLLTLLWLMRWGLRPLREIAGQVHQIEQGQREAIEGQVPRELHPLTSNLNSLMQQNRQRQERMRNRLADLSHSLKTPLAVLRGAAGGDPAEAAALIREQTARIDEIVSYHRQRAAVAGGSGLLAPLAVRPTAERIVASLHKVHRDSGLHCEIEITEQARLRIDQGDLFELLGNLLENAFKHARSRIRLSLQQSQLVIEDDGPGIPAAQVERLLQRGERADQNHPGEGIGLALVREITRQYAAELQIEASTLGGARIGIRFPSHEAG